MKILRFVLFFLILLAGVCLAIYGGIGASFLLGGRDPGFYPLGLLFVAIASVGLATAGLGIRSLLRKGP